MHVLMEKCLTNKDNNKNNHIKFLANKIFIKVTTCPCGQVTQKINLLEAKIYWSRTIGRVLRYSLCLDIFAWSSYFKKCHSKELAKISIRTDKCLRSSCNINSKHVYLLPVTWSLGYIVVKCLCQARILCVCGGRGGGLAILTPNFVAQIFLTNSTLLHDIGKISLAPPLYRNPGAAPDLPPPSGNTEPGLCSSQVFMWTPLQCFY